MGCRYWKWNKTGYANFVGADGAYQFWMTDPDGNKLEKMETWFCFGIKYKI